MPHQRFSLPHLIVAGGTSICVAVLFVLTFAPQENPDDRRAREHIYAIFSPGLAPSMLKLRTAIESDKDTPDDTILRWFSASQVGTDQDRREAATLFLGLAIDWPVDRVKKHHSTLTHIAGELIANSNGDESIAWAGLAIACELRSQDSIKSLADGVHRSATSAEWKQLYAEAYRR